MSTKHHKVSAHLPSSLNDKLNKWMEEHGHTKYSGAIIAILRHYFNDNIPDEVMPQTFYEQLNDFEELTINGQIKIEELEQDNIQLKEELNSVNQAIEQIKNQLIVSGLESLSVETDEIPRELATNLSFTKNDIAEGLTKEKLCKKLDLTIAKCNEYAKNLGIEPGKYVLERTGWVKDGKRLKPNLKWEYYSLINSEPLEESKLLKELGLQTEFCNQILKPLEIAIEDYIFYRTDWQKNSEGLYELCSDDQSLIEARKDEIYRIYNQAIAIGKIQKPA